ncbi:helix-turn-helix transcriptional regulator [Streptomyces sp. NPDC086519]|uniref:helix-turn-helix domain-containing protein n=1 Tax=Streptomyces sp. NPDC086519 TaxID=3154863 RepID=UPI00341D6B86
MTEAQTAEQAVGRRIKALRGIRGWSQQQLASRMSVAGFSWGQTTVTKTENAERPLRVNEAVQLAHVFGVSVGDLLASPADGHQPALVAAARQRVKDCERTKAHADEKLAEALSELSELLAGACWEGDADGASVD